MTRKTSRIGVLIVGGLGLVALTAAYAAEGPRLARHVLEALTPAQARSFAEGADPAAIIVEGGRTLAQLLAQEAAATTTELAYTPVDPCVLARTASAAAGALVGGETRALRARGNLSAQGGAAAGCGVPAAARALAVILRVQPSNGKGSLRIWPAGDPEPGVSVLDYGPAGSATTPVLFELCQGESCAADFKAHAIGAGAHIRLDVVGYFSPLTLTTGPKGDPGPPGPPGPSCTVTSTATDATLSCPDGSSVSWPLGPPPPRAEPSADPAAIVVEGVRTLAELQVQQAAATTTELAYTPVDPCVLARTVSTAAGALAGGETRALRARGNLGAQGGAAAGCGVPAAARALAVILRVQPSGGRGSLRIWPAGDPEPGVSVLDYGPAASATTPVLLELCQGESCAADFEVHAIGAGAHVRLDIVGYFSPLALTSGPKGDPGPPGPSCTVTSTATDATQSCPDGSSVSWPLGPPPQRVIRTFQIDSSAVTLGPGEETVRCYFFRTPNTEMVGIKRFASVMTPTVHDMTLFITTDAAGQPVDQLPPGTMSTIPCGLDTGTTIPAWTYDATSPLAELVLPTDDGAGKPVAIEMPANSAGYLRIHFFNHTLSPALGQVTVQADALAPDIAYTRSGTYVTYDADIDMPPNAVGYFQSHTCDVPAGAKFWRLSTHTHKQSVHTAIKDGPNVAFASTDWEHPGAATFSPPSFFSFSSSGLTYECTYDNVGENHDNTIRVGFDPFVHELCLAVGYFFPATKQRFCYNNFLDPLPPRASH